MSDDSEDFRRGKGVAVKPGKDVKVEHSNYADVLLEAFDKEGLNSELVKEAVGLFGMRGVDERLVAARKKRMAAR